MFEEIRLRRLGVIDEASLTLGPGFTVVTGETGAGKTMVVTALALLQGGRADIGLVRDGTGQARVEGTVSLSGLPDVAAMVEAAGGDQEDDAVILARSLSAEGQGRSRAFLGGAAVPASVLTPVGERLVTVHGQSEQHRLRQPAAQREALDRFAGQPASRLLAGYRPAHRRLATARAELADLVAREQERAREIDALQHGLDEIAAMAPQPGEDDTLRAEEDRLAHAESLLAAAEHAHAALAGTAEQAEQAPDVVGLTATARAALDAVRHHDAGLAGLADRAAELSYSAADLAMDLAAYAQGVDVDPARLAGVQARRSRLAALTRKYGPTVDDVVSWSEQAGNRLSELQGADDAIDALRAEVAELAGRVSELAGQLTAVRVEAASTLSQRVSAELAELAMPDARLVVAVRPAGDLGSDGADDVELQLAPSAGTPARRLAQGASGGELSRVMLALEVVLADTDPVPTFVFDEIDAGIGGRAAVEVGRRLARLARRAQVLVVTHLPQVAAFADRHYVVAKSDDGTVSTSGVRALDSGGRVRELSRMLAGLEDSATAAAHAEELLELAMQDRGPH
jgi:DNA repair protein RecN (Recombination protein N)